MGGREVGAPHPISRHPQTGKNTGIKWVVPVWPGSNVGVWRMLGGNTLEQNSMIGTILY